MSYRDSEAIEKREAFLACFRSAGFPEHDVGKIADAYPLVQKPVWEEPGYSDVVRALGRDEGQYYKDISDALPKRPRTPEWPH